VLRAAGRLLVVLLLAGAAWIAWQAWTWPDVAALASRPPTTTAFIERWRAAQRAAGRGDRVDRVWVPYARISPHLKRAVLVAEDINFFSHTGFDLGEIRQAIGKTIDEGVAPRGASTVTQQLAKNLWLSPSRNPLRKVKEAILTWQLERQARQAPHPRAVPERRRIRPGRVGRRGGRPALLRAPPPSSTRSSGAVWRPCCRARPPGTPGRASPAYRRHVDTVRRRMDKADFLRRQLG
jgi:hypothetical protein